MTTYSQTDLATRALRKANIIGAEETPSAADIEFAKEMIASDTAALARRGIYIVNGSDLVVPVDHLEPRAAYHAVTLKADYGMISDAEALQTRRMMEAELRQLSAKRPTGEILEVEYF